MADNDPADTGRRNFLRGIAALPLAYAAGASLPQAAAGEPQGAAQPFPGLIRRSFEPDNLEMPFD